MGYRKRGENSYQFQCLINGVYYSKTIHVYDLTKAEIEKMFLKWKMECEQGEFSNSKMTFNELSDVWIRDYCEPNFSPVVVKNYKRILNNWVLPEFGNKQLVNIVPLMISRFLEKLKNSYTTYPHRENHLLSNGSIKKIYNVLRDVIKLAYRNDIISKDPCTKVKFEPRKEIVESTDVHTWDIAEYNQALRLLSYEDSVYALVVETALKTGLRRSEIFGLAWEDVDLVNNSLNVVRTRQKSGKKMVVLPCKTQSSVRKLSIPTSLSIKLKKHHQNNMNTTYVFENVDYDVATSWYREWAKKSGLTRIRFHDLRHTHATLLLSQGIDVKTIANRLGHSNISTTLNTYAHVLDELDRSATDALEKISNYACE